MRYTDNGAEDIKIAYIGGGSRGWAWGLMSDLAAAQDMSGSVFPVSYTHLTLPMTPYV